MKEQKLKGPSSPDLERNEHQFLMNHAVQTFSWTDLTVTVKDRRTKQPRNLIDGSSGLVQQGRSSIVPWSS